MWTGVSSDPSSPVMIEHGYAEFEILDQSDAA
jgi:hypothetical protein